MQSVLSKRFLISSVTFLGCIVSVGCGSPSKDEIRDELADFVSTRNQCASDDECELVATECPLGCYQAVNASFAKAVESKARELVEDYEGGGQACAYDCVEATGVKCADDTCEVQLRAEDAGTP